MLFQAKTDYLKKYLAWRNVPPSLRVQVTSFLMNTWLTQKGVDEESLLRYLCPSLRETLINEQLGGQIKHCVVLKPFSHMVTSRLQARNYMQGDVVVHTGELSDVLFFVARGVVEIQSDNWQLLQKLNGEGVFSESSFFGQKAHFCNALCAEQTSLFCLHYTDFLAIVEDCPDGKQTFAGVVTEFLARKGGGAVDLQKNLQKSKIQMFMADEVKKEKKGIVFLPSSNMMRIWDVLMIVTLLWNCFTVPFKIGFVRNNKGYLESTIGLVAVDVLFDLFCIVTMVMRARFFASYKGGVLKKTNAEITQTYIKTPGRFLFDLLCFFPVDLIVLGALSGTDLRETASMYAAFVRIPRMLYLIRIGALFQSVEDALDERMIYVKGGYRHIVRLMIFILLASHWMASIRGIIAWAEDTVIAEEGKSLAASYAEAIYWAIYTITT